ncbi:hypothetical protein AMS68_007585 [Peltaster fructicola]|uniref:Asp/Glu/hydantoin racemase n=1 Tax=Peltaster fructicola TaxID=286661 RepID=A0A6H0Y5F0_9PEZI|nr:hypothetical protein AMS68_007585 [Peltaster fructicola]
MASTETRVILVINPNTTQAITDALKPILSHLRSTTVTFDYYTATSGVPSINNLDDADISTKACLPDLKPLLENYDAFLVACYSPHPLVRALHQALVDSGLPAKPVTGIFEASVATCLASLRPEDKFGIVSTGSQWQGILNDGIVLLLGTHASGSPRYAGTQTTGLNANELHDAPKDEITKLMSTATRRLLDAGARAICLGCAGMAGLDSIVRQACIDVLGQVDGSKIRIVDGVVSGALHLESEIRALSIAQGS